ncbi:EF-hand calcium-binding domain-containing protein 4A-like isoform X2 [Adelges cooleyi]|uniref:EF-hand calcium-binding domain-containing protein 4A-like isoform X2 n=1 Tax=Adelges cooleyi TaxID=133065 RepID=UPI0021802195|nr:EF-hand calcium-binding domain-containing protein 4A-like isoform X2 [Adelges cooleyi]
MQLYCIARMMMNFCAQEVPHTKRHRFAHKSIDTCSNIWFFVAAQQKLKDELCMTPEQLEIVFDTLDVEQKGYLTLDQFLERFKDTPPVTVRNKRWKEKPVTFKLSFSDDIQTLLLNIKEFNMLKLSIGHLENICKAVQSDTDSSAGIGRVEAFLRSLQMDLTKIAEQNKELEELLQSREVQHQNNMQKLFEELECHFREEQEKTKIEDQLKFKNELSSLESEISEKEERLRAAIYTRQEFASQLVSAQKRELSILNSNAELTKKQELLANELDKERAKSTKFEELLARAKIEAAVSKEKHFKQGFYVAKNLVSLKEEGPGSRVNVTL